MMHLPSMIAVTSGDKSPRIADHLCLRSKSDETFSFG
jgi:hypothetical protein